MAKSNKKRAIVYSNVKKNKKRAEEITKIKDEHINLNDEIIIGMSSQVPKKSSAKSKKNTEFSRNKSLEKPVLSRSESLVYFCSETIL